MTRIKNKRKRQTKITHELRACILRNACRNMRACITQCNYLQSNAVIQTEERRALTGEMEKAVSVRPRHCVSVPLSWAAQAGQGRGC